MKTGLILVVLLLDANNIPFALVNLTRHPSPFLNRPDIFSSDDVIVVVERMSGGGLSVTLKMSLPDGREGESGCLRMRAGGDLCSVSDFPRSHKLSDEYSLSGKVLQGKPLRLDTFCRILAG